MATWDPFDDLDPPEPDPALPEVVFIAGFLGLDLLREDGVRIWLTPSSFMLRDVAESLTVGPGAPALEPAGLNRVVYGDMIRELGRAGFRVHALNFDFRKPIRAVAAELAAELTALTELDPERRFAFVGHSLGALIAAVYPHVDGAWRERITRAVFLGGPLAGTFDVVEAALGVHPNIGRLAELSMHNDPAEFAACMRTWPVLYDMLPDPESFAGADKAFTREAWPRGIEPDQALLDSALETRCLLRESKLFEIPCAQIVSVGFTTIDAYAEGPIVAPGPRAAPGDAMVSARTACYRGVTAYYVDTPHTLLPTDSRAIDATIALLRGEAPRLNPVTEEIITAPPWLRHPTLKELCGAYLRERMLDLQHPAPLQDLCWLIAPRGWC